MAKPKHRFFKEKWQKKLAVTIVGIAALFLLIVLLLELFLPSILAEKIKAGVSKGTGSLYHVTFDPLEIHLFKGEIILHNITLTPDSTIYHNSTKSGQAPEKLYILRVKTAIINHTHPFKLYMKHVLDIGNIELTNPELIITFHPLGKTILKPKDNRTIYQQISKSLKWARVSQILFKGLNIKYEDFSNKRPAISELKQVDLKAIDLLIDSATQFDKSRFLYCHELTTELHNYNGRTENALYTYSVQLIKYSTLTRKLIAYHFALRSLQNPTLFFQKTYKDRFNFNADSVQLTNFDFELYRKSHTLSGSRLLLSTGNVDVYSNPRTDPKSFHVDKAITFPNKALRMLPVSLKIDTINVRRFKVRYDEFNVKTKQKGHISFEQINGNFYNVTNDSAALKKNSQCNISLDALFLHRATAHLDMQFNLDDSLYSYQYKGRVGTLDLQDINVATIPLASLAIKSGTANSFDFKINGNRKMARGNVTLLYQGLKVHVLKADTQELKMRKQALATLMANTIIVKANNPDEPAEPPRIAHVVYQRPLNFAFFKTLWRTLLMGIKPCAGLDTKAPPNADVKMQQKNQGKFKKKERKAMRKKRRAEKRELKRLKKEKERTTN